MFVYVFSKTVPLIKRNALLCNISILYRHIVLQSVEWEK